MEDMSALLSKEEKKYIQQVIGTFLYYVRAVDSTMPTALSSIASAQAEPMQATLATIKLFLDYAATHQDAVLTYHASDLVLVVHSCVSYLSKPKACSQAGGHIFMSSNAEEALNNVTILNIAQLIKAVMSLAAEAELGALYINAQIAQWDGTSTTTNPNANGNSTALGVVNSNIQPRQTKAMDMIFHWLQDRNAQLQLQFFWRPGKSNIGDYWTKHHCAVHHIKKRNTFLTPIHVIATLQAYLQCNAFTTAAPALWVL